MGLPFNVGELATRLRRGLGVRGRIPLDVDERVIAAAGVSDLTTPPYRTPDVGGIVLAHHAETFGGAGSQNLTIRNDTLAGGPFGNDLLVLRELIIQTSNPTGITIRYGVGSISTPGAISDSFRELETEGPGSCSYRLCTGGVLGFTHVQGACNAAVAPATFPLGNVIFPTQGNNRVFAVEVVATSAVTARVTIRASLYRGLTLQ